MITDWITVNRVKISNAEQLYPWGLDWEVKPGVNAIVGGTSLGKTTLVYALQFGIFEKMIVDGGERVEREFFKDRLTNRSAEKTRENPPAVEIHFSVGGASFVAKRNLLTGTLIEAFCDGALLKGAKYGDTLAEKVGLPGDFPSLARLQSHLLFFGEGRYLLAWENLLQNELLNLMLSDHANYVHLRKLWDEVESTDSEARNISAQASRLEKDLEALGGSSNVRELERRTRLKELTVNRELFEARIGGLQKELRDEQTRLDAQDTEIARAHVNFHQNLDRLEAEVSADLDDNLLNAAFAATPTIASMRHALEEFLQQPEDRTCPCCGRPGLSPVIAKLAEVAAAGAQTGHCIVCRKEIGPSKSATPRSQPSESESTNVSANKLQGVLFKREQTKSRIDSLRQEEARALSSLAENRTAELKFLREHPSGATDSLRVTVDELRKRQRKAERRREKNVAELRKKLAQTNAKFKRIQTDIAKAFKKYATLYLDEPCDVAFLQEGELPGKKGPQIKAPHAAFFPVVSGHTRPSAQALSEAQRSFIDLAFRMAVVDVWHQQTGKTMTMIVETPEGAVDIAYMERVATMLRTFASHGHTLIITTNLNNDIFLPEILAGHPKGERMERILNLIERGRPRKVQKAHHGHFEKILRAVEVHAVAR